MVFKNQAEMIDRTQHERHEARMTKQAERRTYCGVRENGRTIVTVIAGAFGAKPLAPRTDLFNHSPDGFQWGYGGSGPSQLALAICADALEDDQHALRVYQDFKRSYVALLTQDRFDISADEVRAIIHRLGQTG